MLISEKQLNSIVVFPVTEHAKLSDCITGKCEARIAQIKSEYEKTLEEKNEVNQQKNINGCG